MSAAPPPRAACRAASGGGRRPGTTSCASSSSSTSSGAQCGRRRRQHLICLAIHQHVICQHLTRCLIHNCRLRGACEVLSPAGVATLDSGKGVPRNGGHKQTTSLVEVMWGPGFTIRLSDASVRCDASRGVCGPAQRPSPCLRSVPSSARAPVCAHGMAQAHTSC